MRSTPASRSAGQPAAAKVGQVAAAAAANIKQPWVLLREKAHEETARQPQSFGAETNAGVPDDASPAAAAITLPVDGADARGFLALGW